MYFSKNSKLSKLLSLTLVCVMVGTVFTGCFKQDKEETIPETNAGLNINLQQTEPTPTETEAPATTPTEPNENMGTVTQQMNIRSTPSQQAAVVGTLYAGDRVEVIRREKVGAYTWAYIKTPSEGWVIVDYIEMDVKDAEPEVGSTDTPAGSGEVAPPQENTNTNTNTQGTKGVITANGLNVRSEASANGKIQGSYNKGDVVTILETKNGWGRTNKGWVKMDYVNLSGNNTTPNTNTNTNTNTGNGSTTVVAKGIVTAKELNIRSGPDQSSSREGSLTYGTRVEIYEKSGSWGRIKDGWIHMDYIYQDGSTTNKSVGATITGNGLNIRSGPGTTYASVGSYSSGDRVTVHAQFKYGNTTWGCTNKGWISMDYVRVDGAEDNTTNDDTNDTTTSLNRSGTITGNGLNIRSGPGKNYDSVGSLNSGDRVTIHETKVVGDTTWGKIPGGWISMAYVDLDD